MREDKKKEDNEDKSDCREKLSAHIPMSDWYDIERKMAIVSRMSTEPTRTPSKSVTS